MFSQNKRTPIRAFLAAALFLGTSLVAVPRAEASHDGSVRESVHGSRNSVDVWKNHEHPAFIQPVRDERLRVLEVLAPPGGPVVARGAHDPGHVAPRGAAGRRARPRRRVVLRPPALQLVRSARPLRHVVRGRERPGEGGRDGPGRVRAVHRGPADPRGGQALHHLRRPHHDRRARRPLGLRFIEHNLDGGAWTGCAAPIGVGAEDGAHRVGPRATDHVGLTTTKSLRVMLDNTGPAIPLPDPTANRITANRYTVESCTAHPRVTEGDATLLEGPDPVASR